MRRKKKNPSREGASPGRVVKGRLRYRARRFEIVPLGGGAVVRAKAWARSGAQEGDLVLAHPSGRIIRVLQSGERVALGTVQPGGEVRLQGTARRVRVGGRRRARPAPGERVLVALPDTPRSACAIKARLGREGDLRVEVDAALRARGLHQEFPAEAEAEAERVRDAPREPDEEDRLDLRSLPTVTIDPEDAKDYDDALSLESLGNGGVRLGVHIADVSHYVRSGGVLDEEAFRRGFSVYPPGGVVPMLPRSLSADQCSLLEGESRRAFSVLIEYDRQRQLRGARMSPSVIQNDARLTYEEAQELVAGRHAAGATTDLVRRLGSLARVLRDERLRRGALDLDTGEARIRLDAEGNPTSVAWTRRLDSHNLVEESMIAANRVVAEELRRLGWPAIYRVHPKPALDSLERLAEWLAPLGYQLREPAKLAPHDLQRLLDRVRGRAHGRLVSYLVLRSLPRAVYRATNEGHYGLALERYLHFTSPIRRYPDLVTHRFLREALRGGRPGSLPREGDLTAVADRCTYREEIAWEAEREVEAIYTTHYMRSQLGEIFTGLVVGAEPFGVFVELDDLPVQGMIPAEEFGGVRRSRGRRLRFVHAGRAVEPGATVRVRVVRADVARRQVEFGLT